VIDFESEAGDARRALNDVRLATARKKRDIRAATERWEAAVTRALASGEPEHAVADAADISVREVRAIARRGGTL